MRLRNKFNSYLIYIVTAGIFRLLLCKRAFTLYICILFVLNVCNSQSDKQDSLNKIDFEVDTIHNNHLTFIQNHPIRYQVLKITDYYKDSIQIIDSVEIKKMQWEHYELNQKISGFEIKNDPILYSEDSLKHYELIYVLNYSIVDNSMNDYKTVYNDKTMYGMSKLIKCENDNLWSSKLENGIYDDIRIWKTSELLVINDNNFFIGQAMNRNSGVTYFLKRK